MRKLFFFLFLLLSAAKLAAQSNYKIGFENSNRLGCPCNCKKIAVCQTSEELTNGEPGIHKTAALICQSAI